LIAWTSRAGIIATAFLLSAMSFPMAPQVVDGLEMSITQHGRLAAGKVTLVATLRNTTRQTLMVDVEEVVPWGCGQADKGYSAIFVDGRGHLVPKFSALCYSMPSAMAPGSVRRQTMELTSVDAPVLGRADAKKNLVLYIWTVFTFEPDPKAPDTYVLHPRYSGVLEIQ
jgi:hypothetical protein